MRLHKGQTIQVSWPGLVSSISLAIASSFAGPLLKSQQQLSRDGGGTTGRSKPGSRMDGQDQPRVRTALEIHDLIRPMGDLEVTGHKAVKVPGGPLRKAAGSSPSYAAWGQSDAPREQYDKWIRARLQSGQEQNGRIS